MEPIPNQNCSTNAAKPQGGQYPTPLEVARLFRSMGMWPVEVPYKAKGPNTLNWHAARLDDLAIQRVWGNDAQRNIGLLNGADVGDIGDADLDTLGARIAARYFLPSTTMRWGRASAPDSHWEYHITDIPEGSKALSWKDPTVKKGDVVEGHKGMLCELGLNKHALAPGSVHPKGEVLYFAPGGVQPPMDIAYATLKRGLAMCATAALIAKFWVAARHNMGLPMAGMLGRGGMSEDEAERLFRAVCEIAGDDELDNRLACLHDTYAKLAANQPVTGGPTLEEYMPPIAVAKIREWLSLSRGVYSGQTGPDGFPLSDIGNAERFAERVKDKALWCDATGDWYIFDDQQWSIDKTRIVRRWAMDTARAFTVRVFDDDAWRKDNHGTAPRDACDRHARQMQEYKHLNAMLDLAKALLPVEPDEFDADTSLLNAQNGTLELRTDDGEVFLREHRASDRLTHMAGAPYIPGATDARLDVFIQQFVPEPDRWAFLEEAGGASLLGGPKRNSINLIGPSHSGKSMMLRLAYATMGTYGDALDPDSLKPDEHGGNRPRSDLLDMAGKRLVVMPEVNNGAIFDGALYKSMFSGGDSKKYRGMYEKHGRELHFTHLLWISGNKPYGVSADDDAAYERACFVRFEHPIEVGARDDREEDATVNSLATRTALLAAFVAGFTRLYRDKHGELTPPDDVKRETARVRSDLNPYSAIVEPEDPDAALWKFTGDANDGVIASEAWAMAREQRESEMGRLKSVTREKSLFDAAMEQHGAQRTQARTRFRNREYWRGVRWVDKMIKDKLATPPDWQTDEEAGGEMG